MSAHDHKTDGSREKETDKQQTVKGATCRCKETAEMKPGQLLKRMIGDLSFWKKMKKR